MARWRHADERAETAIDAASTAVDGSAASPPSARVSPTRCPTMSSWSSRRRCRSATSSGSADGAARAHSNRGANGIDGVVSTALGRALGGRPTVVLVGDIAFVHDSNALVALPPRGADLRIVVIDNDGGGIFSFLPQATALPSDRFEQLFGTPHGTDIEALAGAHGVDAAPVSTADELRASPRAGSVGDPGRHRSSRQRPRPRPPERRRRPAVGTS